MNVQELRDRVAAQRTVIDSATALIRGLHEKLDSALKSGNTTELQALADSLKDNTDVLSSAVVENTPADPSPTSAPSPTVDPTPGT